MSSPSVDLIALFTLVQTLKSFEAAQLLLSSRIQPILHEVQDHIALLLGTFLLVIDAVLYSSTSVSVFLKLNGLHLIKAFLKFFKVDDLIFDSPLRVGQNAKKESVLYHPQRHLISGEMGNLPSRLLSIMTLAAEEAASGERK